MTTEQKKPFRILSLDGGGVRAIIQAQILARIVREYPNFLKEVDLFCGTSAGAIVASALCSGISPVETVNLYEQEVGKIFSEQITRRIFSVDNAIGAAYTPAELQNMLTKEFGDKTLADLPQKLFIPTFRLDLEKLYKREDNQPAKPTCRWTPEFLHNLPHSKNADTKVVDAVLRTTAAPTYFPIYQGAIDGGVVANNPALAALSTALAGKQTKLEDVVIMSLSTGCNPKGIHSTGSGNYGLLEWAPHIVELLLDSSTEAIDYQCRCFLQERYHRIDPFLPRDIGLDDASALPELKQIANEFNLNAVKEWIEAYWKPEVIDTSDLAMSIEELKIDDVKIAENPASWRCSIQ